MGDELIVNPNEQSAYKYIPGTTQEVKPAVVAPVELTVDQQEKLAALSSPQVEYPESMTDDQKGKLDALNNSQNNSTGVLTTGQEEQVTTQSTNQPTNAATNNTGQEEQVTTQTTGQQQQVTTPKTHLYNWGGEGVTLSSVLQGEGKDKPMSQIINDYYAWAGENGITPNVLDIYDAMRDKDTSKSYAQNEQDEKKRLRKEKWDKVGMFLTHLGNAIGTFAGGGHMPIKTEDPVQWSERQRKLREATLAQRNAYNQSALAQQAKLYADQRKADMDKQKQANDTRRLDIAEADQKRKAYKDEYMIKLAQKKFDYQQEKDKLDRELKERQITQKDYALRIQAMRAATADYTAHNPVQTTTTTEQDENGNKVVRKNSTRGKGGGNNYSQYKVQNGGNKDYSQYKVQK